MSRGKYTAAEKRQASKHMKAYWAAKKATRTIKRGSRQPSKAAIRQFTKAVQGLFA
jgi:hypothetical protein